MNNLIIICVIFFMFNEDKLNEISIFSIHEKIYLLMK